jgi:hypothetical protein
MGNEFLLISSLQGEQERLFPDSRKMYDKFSVKEIQ